MSSGRRYDCRESEDDFGDNAMSDLRSDMEGRGKDPYVPIIVSDQGKPVGVLHAPTVSIDVKRIVRILYTNWKGETAWRQIIPDRIWFGSTKYHEEPQWLLDALDVDKGADRTFAVRDIHKWRVEE